MSADNGIYILPVKKKNGKLVYRVGYAAAIDNLDWYIQKDDRAELENYVNSVWKSDSEYATKEEAYVAAGKEEECFPYPTEYGVCMLRYTYNE